MILPHYIVETDGPKECSSYVKYSHPQHGIVTLLECHEYDAEMIATMLNKVDPGGENFLGSGIDRVVDHEHLLI